MARRDDGHVYHDREARVKVHFNVSTASIYNILRGRREVQQDSRLPTGHRNHGAGTVYLDGCQQPGSSGSASTPTSTPPLSIHARESDYSYSRSSTTSRGKGTGRQADGSSIEGTCVGIKLGEVQYDHRQELLYKGLALEDAMVHYGETTKSS